MGKLSLIMDGYTLKCKDGIVGREGKGKGSNHKETGRGAGWVEYDSLSSPMSQHKNKPFYPTLWGLSRLPHLPLFYPEER